MLRFLIHSLVKSFLYEHNDMDEYFWKIERTFNRRFIYDVGIRNQNLHFFLPLTKRYDFAQSVQDYKTSYKTSVKTYQDICNRNIIIGNDTNSHPFHYPRSIEISYVKKMCFYHNNFALLYRKIIELNFNLNSKNMI